MTEKAGLFYQTSGKGPLVVLLHGLLMDGESWQQSGLVTTLGHHFCVVCPDLPGHGHSLDTRRPESYSLREMAADIIAIIDRLGYERAHIIGYSAGGWLATGLLKYFPQRLASLVVGGWDCVNGLPQGPNGKLSFSDFMTFARDTAPELANRVTARNEPALSAFFSSLGEPQRAEEELKRRTVPALFWAGRQDFCYPAVAGWAAANDFALLTAEGDHLAAVLQPANRIREAICDFVMHAERG